MLSTGDANQRIDFSATLYVLKPTTLTVNPYQFAGNRTLSVVKSPMFPAMLGVYIADTFCIVVHPEICASVESRRQVLLHVDGWVS